MHPFYFTLFYFSLSFSCQLNRQEQPKCFTHLHHVRRHKVYLTQNSTSDWSRLRFLVRDHSFGACVLLKWRNRQFVDQTFARHFMCGRGLFPRPYPSLWLLGFTSYKLNNSNVELACLVWILKKWKWFRERTPCSNANKKW